MTKIESLNCNFCWKCWSAAQSSHVIVACSYVLAFQNQTPSQSEIFYVIVACLYVLGFKDQTPSQSEIFSVIVDCCYLLGFKDQTPPKVKYSLLL